MKLSESKINFSLSFWTPACQSGR